MLQSKSKYYFTRLDAAAQRVYRNILKAWEARDREPSFLTNPLGGADIQKIVEYIASDNPGLFYVDFSRITFIRAPLKTTVQSDFLFSDSQVSDMEKQLKQAASALFAQYVPDGADNYAKELALHDALAQTVSYAYEGRGGGAASIVGGLLTHRAVCEGYAKTFKLLCDLAGLSCLVVCGRAKPHDRPEENHAWNIVKLGGACAHVDVTWDSTMRQGNEPCYDHFNLTDQDAGQDHFWERPVLPPCASAQNNYFVRNGSYVASSLELKNLLAARLLSGEKTVSVRFNRKFDGQEQVLHMVSKMISQDPQLSKIRLNAIGLRYNPVRSTASISLM